MHATSLDFAKASAVAKSLTEFFANKKDLRLSLRKGLLSAEVGAKDVCQAEISCHAHFGSPWRPFFVGDLGDIKHGNAYKFEI